MWSVLFFGGELLEIVRVGLFEFLLVFDVVGWVLLSCKNFVVVGVWWWWEWCFCNGGILSGFWFIWEWELEFFDKGEGVFLGLCFWIVEYGWCFKC